MRVRLSGRDLRSSSTWRRRDADGRHRESIAVGISSRPTDERGRSGLLHGALSILERPSAASRQAGEAE